MIISLHAYGLTKFSAPIITSDAPAYIISNTSYALVIPPIPITGILPVAIRMVYEVSHNVKIPVIGMGGITNAYEVLEMMYAGASLVMIGAENLVNPYACRDIINDLPVAMNEYHIENLEDIIGRCK